MKEFVEHLLPYERNLFFLLNGSDSVTLDNIMSILSNRMIWYALYAIALFFIFYKTPKKEAFLVLLFCVLVFALCDQFSSGFVKHYFARLRPGNHPDFKDYVKLVNGHRGGGYSFISGHATNSFGFAVILSLIFRNRWITLVSLIWATSIAYSRIYLGMHFISDVVGGILSGILIAFMMYGVLNLIRKKFFHLENPTQVPIYSQRYGTIFAIAFAAYYLGVILFTLLSSL